jgi:hypothetical protein
MYLNRFVIVNTVFACESIYLTYIYNWLHFLEQEEVAELPSLAQNGVDHDREAVEEGLKHSDTELETCPYATHDAQDREDYPQDKRMKSSKNGRSTARREKYSQLLEKFLSGPKKK